jgi:hypothetical protein
VIRADLPIGVQGAQLIHAAGESALLAAAECVGKLIYAVCLTARDEAQLGELERQLTLAGIRHYAMREPDLGGALTAIGICPIEDRRMVRRYLSSYPLLKGNSP